MKYPITVTNMRATAFAIPVMRGPTSGAKNMATAVAIEVMIPEMVVI